MTRKVRMVAAVMALGLVAGACSKKPPVTDPAPGGPSSPTTGGPGTTMTSTPPTTDGTAERDREIARIRGILEQMVFFDYDESSIRDDAKEALAAKVPLLQGSPSVRIRIEGHADERGSVEYNLALGMRRAQAVRDYLAGFGIDAQRFDIQSFGEDRPLAGGSSEQSWSQNRRAEFRVTTGTINVR